MQFQRVLMREPAQRARAHQRRLHLPEEGHLRRGDRAPVEGDPPGQRPQGDAVRALLSRPRVPRARHVRGRADVLPEDRSRSGPNLIEAYYELGRAYWFNGQRDEAMQTWRDGFAANKFNPWGKRCAEVLQTVEQGGRAVADRSLAAARRSRRSSLLSARRAHRSPRRTTRPGASTPVASPSCSSRRTSALARIARSTAAAARDSFPWLPRPRAARAHRHRARHARGSGSGPAPARRSGAPRSRSRSRGASIMQGRSRRLASGRPARGAASRARASRAARAPGRPAAALVRRGLRERSPRDEWRRDDVLATNVALALRGAPAFEQLEASFAGGATRGAVGVCAELSRGGGAGGARSRARAHAVLPSTGSPGRASMPRCARPSA